MHRQFNNENAVPAENNNCKHDSYELIFLAKIMIINRTLENVFLSHFIISTKFRRRRIDEHRCG